jgi:L-seryl-tRNA(Ser) seleniumtransferase
MRHHPLLRALRVDKLTYAALEATLIEHLAGRAARTVPVAAMIAMPRAAIEARATGLARRLSSVAGVRCEVVDGVSTIGGGSAPGSSLSTRLLALEVSGASADEIDARLRAQSPAIVARIERDRVVLDLRTVRPDEDDLLADLLTSTLSATR